ncbi:MAG: hypothetical protein U0X20_14930 [Caldilineaceae bacterium]
MAKTASVNATAPITPDASPPGLYKASWIDRLMTWVDALPWPYWLTYLVLGLAETAFIQCAIWLYEPEMRFVVQLETAVFPLWTWGVLALMMALNQEAILGLHRFHPLLDADEANIATLEYEITKMPARTVLLTTPVWLVIFALIAITSPIISHHLKSPILYSVLILTGLVAFLVGTGIYIHTVHQLRVVNRLYAGMKKINMFHLAPVHAFSSLTAQTAIGFVVLIALTQLMYPYSLMEMNLLLLFVSLALMALAVFILPLRHAHQRLVSGKQRLQADAAQRMETALHHLHEAVDEQNIGALDGLNKIVAAISNERDILAKIHTWPWPQGTLRAVTTVMLVPIALFLIQAILRRWFGF